MNLETLLTDTLSAHEDLAPDGHAVMAQVRQRIEARGSSVPRRLAIGTSVAVMAGVAVVAVNVSRHAQHDATSPRQQHAAAAPPSTPRTLLASNTASALAPNRIDPLTMPFDLGWLPAGTVHYLNQQINMGSDVDNSPSFDGEYMLSVTDGSRDLAIDVAQMPGTLADAAFKSGPGRPVTINGHAGVESKNVGDLTGYEVYFTDERGRLMYVNVSAQIGSTAPASELVSAGRRVAEGVHYPGTRQVNPSFGLGYIPAGLRIRAFIVQSAATVPVKGTAGALTQYEVGTRTAPDSTFTVQTTEGLPVTGTPGRTVQGHPTRWSTENGYTTCAVLNAVGGTAVEVTGKLSRTEIYTIADGLELPGR